jgi:hypothetical protein
MQRCSRCHTLFAPADRPASRWRHEVHEMAGNAHLSGGDRDLVLLYLTTMAGRP